MNVVLILKRLIASVSVLALMLTVSFPSLAAPSPSCPKDMILISGGTFRIGSDDHYPEERAADDVQVSQFYIDRYEVTKAQFAEFVKNTGYVTVAERPLSEKQFPELSEEDRSPGSVVFQQLSTPNEPIEFLSWWQWLPGANWRPYRRSCPIRSSKQLRSP